MLCTFIGCCPDRVSSVSVRSSCCLWLWLLPSWMVNLNFVGAVVVPFAYTSVRFVEATRHDTARRSRINSPGTGKLRKQLWTQVGDTAQHKCYRFVLPCGIHEWSIEWPVWSSGCCVIVTDVWTKEFVSLVVVEHLLRGWHVTSISRGTELSIVTDHCLWLEMMSTWLITFQSFMFYG